MQSSAIKVGNRTYSLTSVTDDAFDALLAQKGVHDDSVKSFIDYDEQRIVVRERLTLEHKQELVLHELLHACLEDSGLRQDDTTESFIAAIAPRFSQLISNQLITVLSEITA